MNHKIVIAFCFFLLIGFVSKAQVSLSAENLSSINIDDVSDNEIKSYYQKAVDNGFSEDVVYKVLSERGLPDSEVEKLKQRIAIIGTGENTNKRNIKPSTNNFQEKNNRNTNDDAYTPMQQIKSDLSIFGSELFTANSLVFEPNLRIPTPTGYILGPDDELIVNVFGYSEKTYNLTVSAEGNIYIPQVGPIFVNGLSIEQASSRIRTKLASTIYKAINNNQTSVQVTLGKIRSIRVTVIGEAKKPGTYTVSSLTTLFNLLYLCGGPSDMGSYRNIELIRGNQIKSKVDLYSFLLKGDQTRNFMLQEGDVIRIPYYTTRVIINGSVKHKGKFEIQQNETFENLLTFAGGFADDAYKANVTIYQLTDKERKITDLAKVNYSVYKPTTSDSIVVGKLLDRYENRLTIKGAIMRPGEYELSEGMQLSELIIKAGGVKEDVYSKRGIISRLNDDQTPTQLAFDIDSVVNNLMNIALKKEDSITIFSIFDLRNEKEIIIDGAVKRPGSYQWVENITLNDVILTAGGLTEFGDYKNIEIGRRIKDADLSKANYEQTKIIKVTIDDNNSLSDIVLEPFDVINIKQQSGYTKQRSIIVEGMVINPGRYTLKTSGDKISDVIKRIGGFTANADSTSIVIRRITRKNTSIEEREKMFSKLLNINQDSVIANERIKDEIYKNFDIISIDLTEALTDNKSSENMVLEDGDIITIERNTNLVKVSGEVYFPTIIPYKKGANLKYYIQKSGSYTPIARKKNAMVIYSDGKAKKTKRFLFFKIYPKVESRSEIFVPQKAQSNKGKVSVGEWALIVSAMGILANVIANFK